MKLAFLGRWMLCGAASLLGGCATTAATDLVASAKQYESRSIEAINAVDLATRREVTFPEVSESAAEARWVEGLRNSQLPTSDDLVNFAFTGLTPTAGPQHAVRQQAFAALRAHHASFSAAFDNVERAGLLGKSTISRCAPPIIEKLVARQVYLARSFSGGGAVRLLAQRSALNAEIDRARFASGTEAERNARLATLFQARKRLIADEDALNAETISSLTVAAQSGLLLHKQARKYGKVSLADIQWAASGLLLFAAASTGRDLTAASKRADDLFTQINADPELQGASAILLERVQDRAADPAADARTCVKTGG